MAGGSATPGTAVLTASSTTPVVTINLDASQQTEVKAGDHVTITLPDGNTTPGVVASVGKVATTSSGGSTTVTVQVTLNDPKAAGELGQAPVTVTITTGTVSNALVVPVTVGLFDDAAGLVQVSGSGLVAGQRRPDRHGQPLEP